MLKNIWNQTIKKVIVGCFQARWNPFAKNSRIQQTLILSLVIAATITVVTGLFLPGKIDAFNDFAFGKVTILYKPNLVDALKTAQNDGVVMAVHGWHHEDYRILDPDTAKALVVKGKAVFEKAGLTPIAFYYPYVGNNQIPTPVRQSIQSELPESLPNINVVDENGDSDDILEVGEAWIFSGTYIISQGIIDSKGNGNPFDGYIHDTFSVRSDQTQKAISNVKLRIAQVTQDPSLEVTATANLVNMNVVAPIDSIDAGDVIPYTVRITNNGSQTLTNVRVRDSLRTGLARRTSGNDQGNNLEPGDSWNYQGSYSIHQDMIDSKGNGNPIDGKIHNVITVGSDQTDDIIVEAVMPIVPGPFLNVVATASSVNMSVVSPKDHIDAGDTISYTIRIYNTGSEALTNIVVSDLLLLTLKRGTTIRGSFGTEYTFGWRDMTSIDDPRYVAAKAQISKDQPTNIMAHFYDWNAFSRQLLSDYIQVSNKSYISIRVDDVEPNTPAWKVTDLAELLKYDKVIRLSFGVIPEGTWMGGSPKMAGLNVNNIFHFYWIFFLLFAFFPFLTFLIWMLLTFRLKKVNNNGSSSNIISDNITEPLVSVIIPAYNEESNISACLEAVQKQDFKGKIEIIVINDGSTDKTAEIATKYPVKLIDLEQNVGKANALNIGLKHATGDIFVFSDSDSELDISAVKLLVGFLKENPDAGAVAGNVLINDIEGNNNLLKRFQMIEYYTDQNISRYLQALNGNVIVCPGPLFAVRREITEDIKFSDQSVIEDADFTIELLKNHKKVYQEKNAKVYTHAPTSIQAWLKQRKRWWYGNLQLWHKHNSWAYKNPWMILNYIGFITALVSLILTLLLPFLFSMYDNLHLVLLRGIIYSVIPMLVFTLFMTPFFVNNRMLLPVILPYTVIYTTMKAVLLSYLFVRYMFRQGVSLSFGPRTILAR